MIDIKTYQDMPAQGSDEWHRQRLGKFNASRVSELVVSGRKKDEYFGKTALSYINEVAAERNLDPEMVESEDEFWIYRELVEVSNKYMRWGSEHEDEAREIYETRHGVTVEQVGSVDHLDIPNYACSPDGLVVESNSGIEIKCPLPKTYWEWRNTIHDAESLKAVKPEYYWQVMAQIDICNLDYVDFVAYCPLMVKPIFEVRIARDDEAIAQMRERVMRANEVIDAQKAAAAKYTEASSMPSIIE